MLPLGWCVGTAVVWVLRAVQADARGLLAGLRETSDVGVASLGGLVVLVVLAARRQLLLSRQRRTPVQRGDA